LWLLLRKQFPWIVIFFAWATLFSFTRIYLGVHYPGDILAGAMLGVLIAYLINWIARKFVPQWLP